MFIIKAKLLVNRVQTQVYDNLVEEFSFIW